MGETAGGLGRKRRIRTPKAGAMSGVSGGSRTPVGVQAGSWIRRCVFLMVALAMTGAAMGCADRGAGGSEPLRGSAETGRLGERGETQDTGETKVADGIDTAKKDQAGAVNADGIGQSDAVKEGETSDPASANDSQADASNDAHDVDAGSAPAETISVQVLGEVQCEGTYTLPVGATLRDAVDAAGGFTLDAEVLSLTLSAVVTQGQTITIARYVPSAMLPDGRLDVNLATHAELVALPGIGDATARLIIAHREAHGPFGSVDEVLKIPGLPKQHIAKYKDLIAVGFTN